MTVIIISKSHGKYNCYFSKSEYKKKISDTAKHYVLKYQKIMYNKYGLFSI